MGDSSSLTSRSLVVGPPIRLEPYRLDDERGFEMYDENGFCCGTVALFNDGSLHAALNYGDVYEKHNLAQKEGE